MGKEKLGWLVNVGALVACGVIVYLGSKYGEEKKTHERVKTAEIEKKRYDDYRNNLPAVLETRVRTGYYGDSNSPAIASGDFDEDGHLDLIVGVNEDIDNLVTRFYFYKGDGSGNFSYQP